MKSVGQIIKETRRQKNLSIDDLEGETKIKRQFLLAIETLKWDKLPEYPVLQGFIRLIGHALDLDEYKLVAVLRRDYQPKRLHIIPRPDIADKFRWSPKLTFFIGVSIVVMTVFGYLVYQYFRFISPPTLVVNFPPEGYVAKEAVLQISGKTSQDSTIKINNQPIVVDPEGKFSGEIEITAETGIIEIKSTSRAGKEAVINRKITTSF
ncbi:hypothetical protein A2125_00605 [Candidatus Woesebacteria bacterium GWB1_43_5]|uniref:HTH cro/C1-type domain-containing protein n=1 Tax=Candidatus Woesebacteria bacterium GWB1_43_5 TaxID=1802474 RepID=A0A1F7WSC6_9BACT|nr:MAG: hypothetical protein A2125_00605 [Candidatus Woesebacteria bacterium GWB1_43_5]